MEFLRKLWQAWKVVGQKIGDFIARLILTLFYVTIFAPFGLGVRLFGDPLQIRHTHAHWSARETGDRQLEDVRRLH